MKYKQREISFLLIMILCICDIDNVSVKIGKLKIIKVNQKQNNNNFSILNRNFEHNVDFIEMSNRNNLKKSKRKIIIKGSVKKDESLIDSLDELPPDMLNEDKYIPPEYVESVNDSYHDININSPDLLTSDPMNANNGLNLTKLIPSPKKLIVTIPKVQSSAIRIKSDEKKSIVVNPIDQLIINQMNKNNIKDSLLQSNKNKSVIMGKTPEIIKDKVNNSPVAKINLGNTINVNQKLNVVKAKSLANNLNIENKNIINASIPLNNNLLSSTKNIINVKNNDNYTNQKINIPSIGQPSISQNSNNEQQLLQALKTLRTKLPYKMNPKGPLITNLNPNLKIKNNVPRINKLSSSVFNPRQIKIQNLNTSKVLNPSILLKNNQKVAIKSGILINPSMPKIDDSSKKKITNDIQIINPAIPSPIDLSKPESKPQTQFKSNLIQNPIYPILTQTSKDLVPLEKIIKPVIPPLVNEKKDADIQELLKGHKNIIENETKLVKIGRKKKKSLKSFLSPLQIAAYNTYNPTPDKIERITHRIGNLTPNPIHHNKNIPSNFNSNHYNQQIKTQQMNIANTIETAKLLSIVQNEIDIKKKIKKNKKLKKKNAKKIEKKKKKLDKRKKIKEGDLKKKESKKKMNDIFKLTNMKNKKKSIINKIKIDKMKKDKKKKDKKKKGKKKKAA